MGCRGGPGFGIGRCARMRVAPGTKCGGCPTPHAPVPSVLVLVRSASAGGGVNSRNHHLRSNGWLLGPRSCRRPVRPSLCRLDLAVADMGVTHRHAHMAVPEQADDNRQWNAAHRGLADDGNGGDREGGRRQCLAQRRMRSLGRKVAASARGGPRHARPCLGMTGSMAWALRSDSIARDILRRDGLWA